MLFGMFSTMRHRKFNYIPMYYDKQKEELNERVEKIKQEMGVSQSEYVSDIKGKMRSRFNRGSKTSSRSIRTWIIASVLGLIAYYIIYV